MGREILQALVEIPGNLAVCGTIHVLFGRMKLPTPPSAMPPPVGFGGEILPGKIQLPLARDRIDGDGSGSAFLAATVLGRR